ncbi:unannotated protein [freshwater metagenome]|uniref:Unannotated protein n=1 Tax=freshwater metagenome TaxID=449393 RepID=A0A6J7HLI1_9ZZZZ
MLTSLRHRTISSRNNKNRTVNLSGTSNHVLDVISMAWHINMRVMTIRSLILNMRNVDRDTTLTLFRRLINIRELSKRVVRRISIRQHLRNRRGQRGLTMIDMTHRAHIRVGLGPLELLACHDFS